VSGPVAPACLITRTLPEAARTAQAVAALGWRPLVCPALAVQPVAQDLARLAALPGGLVLLTSAQAARHAPQVLLARPALCVGDATAEAARARGFAAVKSAAGDAAALEQLVLAEVAPQTPLVWLRGAEVAVDLAARLTAAGRTVEPLIVYATGPDPQFGPALAGHLEDASPGALLVHSPAAARRIAGLLAGGSAAQEGPDRAQEPSAFLSRWRLVAISQAAARPLAACGFAAVAVPATPDGASVLAALGAADAPPARAPLR
jgi:uroporphyrinogen-III synthase